MEKLNKTSPQEIPEFKFGDGINPETISYEYFCENAHRLTTCLVEYDLKTGRKIKFTQKYHSLGGSKLVSLHVYKYDSRSGQPVIDINHYYHYFGKIIRETLINDYSPQGRIAKTTHNYYRKNGKKFASKEINFNSKGAIDEIINQRYRKDGLTLKGKPEILQA